MWKRVNDETNAILGPPNSDPEERNRRISAAYARMFEEKPSYRWIGLAAIVSRQAGCAMRDAGNTIREAESALARDEQVLINGWAGEGAGGIGLDMAIRSRQLSSAQTAREALGVANREIFSDIYPMVRAVQLYGYDAVEKCQRTADGTQRVPTKLLPALRGLESPDPAVQRAAADQLAAYEQRDVIQSRVYAVERYKDVLEDNEFFSSWKALWIGRLYGARPAQLSLSSQCGGEAIPFDGSIVDSNARIQYYRKLMDLFQTQSPQWQHRTMQNIINQNR
jgi:hypothetical protein